MENMEMENRPGRFLLKQYFYGGGNWLSILFWLSFPVMIFGGKNSWQMGVIMLIVWAGIKLVMLFSRSTEAEQLYDDFLVKDMSYLKKRAVEHMGLVPEEYSLIEPIVTNWFGSDDDIITRNAFAEKKDFINKLIEKIKSIPMAIVNFVRRLLGLEDNPSKAIFFEGNDKKIRSSLRIVAFIAFTEKQVVVYICRYDIALGIILSEYVTEIFYRDIDSVKYGNENWHITTAKGSLSRVIASKIILTVSSQSNIILTVPANWDLMANMATSGDVLENQVMAMKSLIRSKKEEMS